MSLFQSGEFTLASGGVSNFKIECDSLTPDDWTALAAMASEILPPFGAVRGVPRGGVPFAHALWKYATPHCPTLLIAEDVVTSGGSIERFLKGTEVGSFARVVGVCAFARGVVPEWVTPVFVLNREGNKA